MPHRHPPILERFPVMLHGGDYNPDQWQHRPDILDEDYRLAELAGVNTFSVGIFAWAALEPEEGRFEFDWLDRTMDRMAEQGMAAVLATPSGARPNWMSAKYPEVLRVNKQGQRARHAGRHNHCPTSPVYRQKVAEINGRLAERYQNHPALALWHISNEYNGECHCDLCYAAFRQWLQERYGTLDELNARYWTAFWAQTYTDWSQIHPQNRPMEALLLDWRRFMTHQCVDFMQHEITAVKAHTPDVPATTNFMGFHDTLDYWRLAEHLDVVCNDCYPCYHGAEATDDNYHVLLQTSMVHDLLHSFQHKPWLLMESSPSATNWFAVPKLNRPGVNRLNALHAVAHGADSVQYFQWRKGQGAFEKFHGAVVDHVGHEHTRVFQDVADVGATLKRLSGVVGAAVDAQVALIFDWDVRWALEFSCGPGKHQKRYQTTLESWHQPLTTLGVSVDVNESTCSFEGYRIVVAPMLFLLKPGVAQRLIAFMQGGGTVVLTYLSAYVDDTIRCFTGGWPGDGLRTTFGIWNEEVDGLYPTDEQSVVATDGNPLGLSGSYAVRDYAERIHAEDAEVVATYGKQFYAGAPAVTRRAVGQGQAIYVAARAEDRLTSDLLTHLIDAHGIRRPLPVIPHGVLVRERRTGDTDYLFLLNGTDDAIAVDLPAWPHHDVLADKDLSSTTHQVTVPPQGSMVLSRPSYDG